MGQVIYPTDHLLLFLWQKEEKENRTRLEREVFSKCLTALSGLLGTVDGRQRDLHHT
jgi:hypothetical protein